MFDRKTTLEAFLTATAARQPTPGGGSVTALAGALATAIGEMVLNYSIGKKGLEIYEGDLRPALAELHCARELMLELMSEDQAAFGALTAAKKLPPGPERDAKLAEAVTAAVRTPEAMAATAVAVLGVCERVMDFCNWYLLSDLAVCAELSMATARCAAYNVRVNLPEMTNDAERGQVESNLAQVLSRAVGAIQRIIPHIQARSATRE